MQTFLPSPDFAASAALLDNKRLGKQRVEAWQILQAITNPSYGWQNHPAVNMWRFHEFTLCAYGVAVCNEWRRRGFKDSMLERFRFVKQRREGRPFWLGRPDFHASHRAALLYKDPAWYGRFGWTEAPSTPDAKGSLPYVWPV